MSLDRDKEQPGKLAPEEPPASVAHGIIEAAFSPGMRVILDGAPINTRLTSPVGTVVAEDQWDTYIVRLDSPAIYRNDDGTEQRLTELRILSFNLTPLK